MAWNATTRHMINLTFSDTSCMGFVQNTFTLVIQDIEKDNFAEAGVKYIK